MSLDVVISKARRNKLGLLVREWFMEIKSKRSDVLSANAACSSSDRASEPCLSTNTWEFHSSVPIEEKIYQQSTVRYQQDKFAEGMVITNFPYQSSKLAGSFLLSNGVTHVSVYDAAGELIPIYSRVKHIHKKKSHLSLSPIKHVNGVSANLYGNVENTAGNYGHWMIDALARLFLIEKDHKLDSIDYFVVPKLKYDFQLDSLIACGIPKSKILEIDTLECFSFDSLICVTPPRASSSGICPVWIIDNYRQRLLSGSKEVSKEVSKEDSHEVIPTKRIYVSRKDANSRKFTNEDELIGVLEQYGFESVELSKFNFAEKISLFAGAQCVVGLTGAGLTNLMFCSPQTAVLELMPRSNVYYLNSSISGYLSHNYRSLIFNTGDLLSKINKYQGNLHLDPALLETNLKQLLDHS